MTYHTYSPELGYVQGEQHLGMMRLGAEQAGMSDLLSPIYVVFEGNEADAFWGLVGVMEIMVRIFASSGYSMILADDTRSPTS